MKILISGISSGMGLDRIPLVHEKILCYTLDLSNIEALFQFGKNDLRVNTIAPSIIETSMTKAYLENKDLMNQLETDNPVGRFGQVDEITPLVDLCIKNTYINSSVLACDSGWSIGKCL